MRILLVAATKAELSPLGELRAGVDTLFTGVGMVATAAHVARALAASRYDLALNFGVCGSFDPRLVPGTVVHVVADRIAWLGAEDGDSFLSLRDLQLEGDDEVVNDAPPENAVLRQLPAVRGLTVNTVHGHEPSIAAAVARWQPQVESMEGAGFMYACRLSGVPFAQVRAVSNAVERRNREAWKMGEAVRNLCAAARSIIDAL